MQRVERRAVVTGLGLVTPIGIGVDEVWKAALSGKSGIGPITHFDAKELPTRIAGEVKNFDPALYMDKKEARRNDIFIQYALAGAAARPPGCGAAHRKAARRGRGGN